MKRLLDLARWSIAGRLITLALAPATLMLLVVNLALYWQSLRDAAVDVQDRGELIARSLAEGSRYGVVSGNTSSIEHAVAGILAADTSVVRIEVLDGSQRPMVVRERQSAPAQVLVFESAITADPLNVDTFDSTPPASRQSQAQALGFVRVTASTAPIVARRAQRLGLGSVLVLLSALTSAALGLALARRLREPLAGVMHTIRSVMEGDFRARYEAQAPGELGELQQAVRTMAQRLQTTHERLESEVETRTVELRQALDRLQVADAEKRRLIAGSNTMVEAERRRISLEIHDDLNAALVLVRMHAAGLATAVRTGECDGLVETADRIVKLVDQTYARARDIVRNLRPEILDALGLPGAVEETVRHFDEMASGCCFHFRQLGVVPQLSEETAIATFRILQEALSNVSKHAGATSCEVTLQPSEAGAGVRLTVDDDGNGFRLEEATGGLGLVSMKERAAALNGRMSICSSLGRGTKLRVEILDQSERVP